MVKNIITVTSDKLRIHQEKYEYHAKEWNLCYVKAQKIGEAIVLCNVCDESEASYNYEDFEGSFKSKYPTIDAAVDYFNQLCANSENVVIVQDVQVPTGTTVEIDWSLGIWARVDLSNAMGNVSFTFINPMKGSKNKLSVKQGPIHRDGIWPPEILTEDGLELELVATDGHFDLIELPYNGTDYMAHIHTNYSRYTYPQAFYDGVSMGSLSIVSEYQELSGLTSNLKAENSDYLWGAYDGSGSPFVAAIDKNDASIQGKWTLSGVSVSDPEDVDSATIDGNNYIYLADIGDNASARPNFKIIRFIEPTVTGGNGTVLAGDIEEITCIYDAGDIPTHKDAETMFVDPLNGDMYIVTKREAIPSLYRLAHAASYVGTQIFEYLGPIWAIPNVPGFSGTHNAVGGGMSLDGNNILIKNYADVYLFTRSVLDGQSIYDALTATPLLLPSYVGGGNNESSPNAERQGEAVCYDGNSIWFSGGEYEIVSGIPELFKYVKTPSFPNTMEFQQGVLPNGSYAGCEDTYIWDSNPDTNYGASTRVVTDINLSDERRGLIKFDISGIPSGSTIIGARLELDTAVEGEGFAFHRVLVPWDENSTYNTLSGGIDPDDVDAVSVRDTENGINNAGYVGMTHNNIPVQTIQDWLDGVTDNYGWLIIATDLAGNGQQHRSSEDSLMASRPKLIIRYI